MNETEKFVEDQFKRLPEALQKALNIIPWKSSVKEIAISNGLSSEQTETLERETMFIIYGFENPADYIANIMREVEINEEVATNIAETVNEKIFEAIAQKLEGLDRPTSETPHNLPMVEKGEVAHEVPHVEIQNNELGIKNNEVKKDEKPKISVPDYRYEAGKDPYREPLQ